MRLNLDGSDKWFVFFSMWLIENFIALFALDEGVDNVEEVSTIVHGVILGVEMPFPMSNPDACKDSGVECPLKNGVNYEYVQTLPVLRSYPKV